MRLFRDLLNKRNEFDYSAGKESQIMKRVFKGKTITVKPSSARYYSKGDEGTYRSGSVSIDNDGTRRRAEKPSTAIKSVKYDPKTQICSVVFVGGSKSYDYKMTPGEFESFMNADSKGRYVTQVMKYQNRLPGY